MSGQAISGDAGVFPTQAAQGPPDEQGHQQGESSVDEEDVPPHQESHAQQHAGRHRAGDVANVGAEAVHRDGEASTLGEPLGDGGGGRQMPQRAGDGQEEHHHGDDRKVRGAADCGEGNGVAQHTRGQDEAPVGFEVIGEGATAQAGGAGTGLAHGEKHRGLGVAQTHGGGNLGDQQGKALVEHMGQAVPYGKAAEDENPVALDVRVFRHGRRGCLQKSPCGGNKGSLIVAARWGRGKA